MGLSPHSNTEKYMKLTRCKRRKKVPRNFKLEDGINRQLVREAFKSKPKTTQTAIVEAALTYWFALKPCARN
jgi:hypothetical protein